MHAHAGLKGCRARTLRGHGRPYTILIVDNICHYQAPHEALPIPDQTLHAHELQTGSQDEYTHSLSAGSFCSCLRGVYSQAMMELQYVRDMRYNRSPRDG